MELIFAMDATLSVTGPNLELVNTIPYRHQRRANTTLASLFSHPYHHTSVSDFLKVQGSFKGIHTGKEKKAVL